MEIMSESSKPVVLDDFMSQYRKMGFARLRMELDSSELLKSKISICSEDGVFWQPFVYENTPSMCYGYGHLGHIVDDYVWAESKQGCGGSLWCWKAFALHQW